PGGRGARRGGGCPHAPQACRPRPVRGQGRRPQPGGSRPAAEGVESAGPMKTTFLEFEQPIAELENRIEELRFAQDDSATDITDEIQRLTKRSATLTKDIYGKLSPWQVSQVARHPQRPYTLDYIQALFTHFEELHGDRAFSDDASIVGGLAR